MPKKKSLRSEARTTTFGIQPQAAALYPAPCTHSGKRANKWWSQPLIRASRVSSCPGCPSVPSAPSGRGAPLEKHVRCPFHPFLVPIFFALTPHQKATRATAFTRVSQIRHGAKTTQGSPANGVCPVWLYCRSSLPCPQVHAQGFSGLFVGGAWAPIGHNGLKLG